MSDPYRTATLRCPACQDTLLRSFLHRLICDRCHGLQIQPDDLMGQIGTGDLVDLVDREATTRVCPRCPQPLTACALRVGDVDLGHGFARCPRHGLWLDGGQLEHVLETIARHGHMGVGGRGKW
ncbi:MAG: hypothetical protein KC464_29380, partial [Myxococcales bacterium]|nr:hypothetical protein [Myxococcales bacterium]